MSASKVLNLSISVIWRLNLTWKNVNFQQFFVVVKMTERRKNQSFTQLFIYFITVNKYRFCISVIGYINMQIIGMGIGYKKKLYRSITFKCPRSPSPGAIWHGDENIENIHPSIQCKYMYQLMFWTFNLSKNPEKKSVYRKSIKQSNCF